MVTINLREFIKDDRWGGVYQITARSILHA